MVDSFRLPVDGESFDDYQHAFHQYYATPEGAGYQQIRQEIVEGLKTLMMNEGIEFWVSGYRVGDSNIKALKHISFDSLLSEAGKKGDNND